MLKIITDKQAREFLTKIRSTRRGFLNMKYHQAHPRGPGSNSAILNYGWYQNDKLIAVARLTPVPYGKSVAAAVVGASNAAYTIYLQREFAVGIYHQELVEFIQQYTQRIRSDTGKDYRYLISLDDPSEIRFTFRGSDWCASAATGKTYLESGALYAGKTKSQGPGRYILDGKMGNLYQGGKNHKVEELRQKGARIIHEGRKDRYLWVLAPKGSILYHAFRSVLPKNVIEIEPGSIWVQPRLLITNLCSTSFVGNPIEMPAVY